MKKTKYKVIKTTIGENEQSFVGQYIKTVYGFGRITHVTKDLMGDEKDNKALTSKEYIKTLEKQNSDLHDQLRDLHKYSKLIKLIKKFEDNE